MNTLSVMSLDRNVNQRRMAFARQRDASAFQAKPGPATPGISLSVVRRLLKIKRHILY